jgi:hypothetical protein
MPNVWYYSPPDSPEAEPVGPISVMEIAALIRRGELEESVYITSDLENWECADVVPEVMAVLPIDRDRILREYLEYAAAPIGQEDWGWASAKLNRIISSVPDLAWDLITTLIEAAPSEDALAFFAAGPLEDLLSDHGPRVIDKLEARVGANAKFLRAVQHLRRLQMTDDVWARVQRAARRAGA